jgi:hypothetical protein
VIAYRFADTPQDRPRHRLTVDYMPIPRLQVGLEYNLAVRELGFRGTYVLQPETERLPMVHFNTSSDRIGTPPGHQLYSVNFSKAIPGTALAPYASITYSEFERGLVYPFGLNWQIQPEWGLMAMNDGRKSHLLLTYSQPEYFVQLGWIWLKHPSVTVGFGF